MTVRMDIPEGPAPHLIVETREGVAYVTLNRPEKRNAMSPELNEEMRATVEALATDARCSVLILTGAGDAFASILILGLRVGWPLATTLDHAQAFASELVQRRGATLSDPGLYRAFAKQWGLTTG